MKTPFDVLIIGAGIVGLTAALSMEQRDLTVALIDSGDFSNPANNIRVYAINAASQNLLQQVQSWQHLPSSSLSPYTSMQVWEAQSGAQINFDTRLIAAKQLGFIIEECALKEALLKQIENVKNITLFPGCKIESIHTLPDCIRVQTKSETWEGQFLLAADGAHSPCRQLLQVPLTSWPYHQEALVATVYTEKPHEKTAYQVFHREGPLAFLPLNPVHHCSIVWSTSPGHAKNLMMLSEEKFNQALTEAFASTLGNTTLLSARQHFPLNMRHVQQYVGERWALLGDAAHTIHPLAGLGLNLGLADISTLLSCCPSSLQNHLGLARYQRTRKHATWQAILLMQTLKNLFETSFIPLSLLRNLGLRTLDKFSPVKRLLINYATGQYE